MPRALWNPLFPLPLPPGGTDPLALILTSLRSELRASFLHLFGLPASRLAFLSPLASPRTRVFPKLLSLICSYTSPLVGVCAPSLPFSRSATTLVPSR